MKSIRYFKRILPVIIAVASTVTLWSCRKDSEQVADPYVRFGGNMQELYYDAVGGKTNIDIFTNVKDWRINIMYYTSEESWIDVFDNRGNESGRVTVTVGENGYAGGFREAEIQVVDKTNFVFGSLKILQRPTEAYLELDMNGITSLTMLGKGGEAAVKVRANVPWEAKVVGGSGDWIDFTGQDVGSLNLNVARKGDAGERSATVRISMIGTGNESNFVDLSLRQLGSESYFENAEKKSVAELISHIDAMPGGAGVINDNYYLEAFVTSDRSRKNTPGEAVFVQDDSGRGMQLLFNADDNDFALNDKLVIQLIGATAIRETGSEALLVNMPGKVNVNSRESSQGIAPVVLDNFAQIDQYENTLVTVNPIEFVIPMGTYMNAQESSYGPLPAEDERALPLGDTPRETGIIMRDSQGQTVRLYSSYVFTDKFSTTIQPGSGALTGIVMKRAMATLDREVTLVPSFVMRLRSNNDNQVSADASSRLSRTSVQFGPFTALVASASVTSTTNGYTSTLRNSVNESVTGNTNSSSNQMYWQWSFMRRNPTTLTEDGRATDPMANNVQMQYLSLNTQRWWTAGKSALSEEQKKDLLIKDWDGEAWILTTSTKDLTPGKKAALSFLTSSSDTGPRFFVAEWADDIDAPLNQWNEIEKYNAIAWDSNRQLRPYNIILPEAIKGKEKVFIRLRVLQNLQSHNDVNGNAISSSGTNRIGFLSISEL